MWHVKMIEKFLGDQKTDPAVVEAIRTRMVEVSNAEGLFHESQLDYVMGENTKLAFGLNQAWKQNPIPFIHCNWTGPTVEMCSKIRR